MKRLLILCAAMAVIFTGATSCQKRFNRGNDIKLSTHVYTKANVDIGEQIATLHGELAIGMKFNDDLKNNDKVGFEWGTDSKLSGANTTFLMGIEGEESNPEDNRGFMANIYVLEPGTRYYYRAFIILEGAREYGMILSFVTLPRKVTDVIVSPSSYVLQLGDEETKQLSVTVYPDDASDLSVSWSSENSSIASVDQNGLVTAQAEGETYIWATSVLTPSVSDKCKIKVQGPPPENSIDMGLPSKVLWRDRNLGASSISDKGKYYAWAEIADKTSYTSDNYKFKGDGLGIDRPSKYSGNGSYGNGGDRLFSLKDGNYEDDAARKNLGGSWRVPSEEEFNELAANCTVSVDSRGGVNGFVFKAKNPDKKGKYNELFFPYGGRKSETSVGFETYDQDTYGTTQAYYWSDHINYYTSGGTYYYVYATCFHPAYTSSSGDIYLSFASQMHRWKGLMIRPVCN